MLILRSDRPFPPMAFYYNRILFVDIDDTVRMGQSTLGYFVNKASQVQIFPQALSALKYYKDHGYAIIGITNQGGVGEGFLSESACVEALERTIELTENTIDAIVYCPHKLTDMCSCRKPLPGMIYRVLSWAPELMLLPRNSMLMVGDRAEDKAIAHAAGIQFLQAEVWRETAEEERKTDD